MRQRARVIPATVATVIISAIALAAADRGPLKPGDVLSRDNWQQAEGMLPPEILDHYKNGEYANPIIDWPEGKQRWGRDFVEATERNRNAFALDEHGGIADKQTGRQPPYVIGFPFPEIDPGDPQAGVKIVWNYFYQYWYNGNSHNVTVLESLGRTGLDRRTAQDVRFLYYDGQPRELAPAENPANLHEQMLARTIQPRDMADTRSLAWRYRDAQKRDSLWAYVPALRRVRQVSPANRSDGFLGSDMSQDDGPFFDGKVSEFIFRLIGEAEMFRLADPYSVAGDVRVTALPGGGWKLHRKDVPFAGYVDPNWKGIAYAPIQLALAKRRFWIVEAVPRDKYYLYGKLLLYFDRETYDGAWNRKFDWQGDLLTTTFNSRSLNHSPDGVHYFRVNPASVMHAENVRMKRATVAAPPPAGMTDAPYDLRIPMSPALFTYDSLLRAGR